MECTLLGDWGALGLTVLKIPTLPQIYLQELNKVLRVNLKEKSYNFWQGDGKINALELPRALCIKRDLLIKEKYFTKGLSESAKEKSPNSAPFKLSVSPKVGSQSKLFLKVISREKSTTILLQFNHNITECFCVPHTLMPNQQSSSSVMAFADERDTRH